jgi:CHAT domain-containing protein
MGMQMQDEVLRSTSATNLSPLPDAEEELKELSAYFRDSSLAIGNKATESEWLRLVQTDPEVISLATHSIQPTNSKFTGLLLNNDEDNDGIITYEEISSNQYLSAKLVILSACNTANTTEYKFQEAYKGLASGFIGAGAKNILVTHWPVYSVAAKELVTSTIYDDANTFAKRLQNSMKKLANSSNTLKSQPIYWAAFSLIGSN